MQISELKRPGAWRALLWKDLFQVRELVLAIVLGMGAIQLILLAVGMNLPQVSGQQGIFAMIVVLGFVSPFLAALGCSGMLIGHERQVGSWAWSSSLPIPWQRSLASKFSVSLLVCLGVFLCLEIIPLSLMYSGHLPVGQLSYAELYPVGYTAIGVVEVLAVYFLASLIFKDTLTGMVAATIGLGIFHATALGMVLSEYRNPARVEGMVLWGVASFITLLATLATTLVFRWRWTSGQRKTMNLLDSLGESNGALPRMSRGYETQATAWSAALWLAMLNNLGLRVLTLLGYLALLAMTLANNSVETSIAIAAVAVALLGITSFAGDQTLGRFRFLADRGVSPWRMALSRLGVAGALAGLVVLIQLTALMTTRWLYVGSEASTVIASFVAIAVVAFFLAALASLCFRQTVVASTTTLMLGAGGLVATVGLIQLAVEFCGMRDEIRADFAWQAIYFGPLGAGIVIAGIFWLMPQWIKRDDHKLSIHFWWIAVAALLLPVVLSLSTAFLRVPYVAWPGLTHEQALLASYPPLPQAFEGEFRTQNPTFYFPLGPETSESIDELENTFQDVLVDDPQVELTLLDLEQWVAAPRLTSARRNDNARHLGSLIVETVLLAKRAIEQENPEMAVRLLSVNRQLHALATQQALIETKNYRHAAIQILAAFSAEDVKMLGGLEVFEGLLPTQIEEQQIYSLRSRADATLVRSRLRGQVLEGVTDLYDQVHYLPVPPLRWYVERKMAVAMRDGYQIEDRYWANHTSSQVFDRLQSQIDTIRTQLTAPQL